MLKRFLALLVVFVVFVFALFWFLGKDVTLKSSPEPLSFIGNSTPVTVSADDPHGVKHFQAAVAQNGQSKLFSQTML